MSECIGCGATIDCQEVGPYDLYSLEGLPFSLILACPAGIDCQHADEIRIVCCKQELFVRIPANATASDRIKLVQDLLQECYRREAFCKGGGCPPGQDCDECPEGVDCADPCALFIVPRPPNCGPITLYFNKPQTCTIKCPDGLPFSYTIKGGLYLALTQIAADKLAFDRACVLAHEHRICLRAAVGSGCIGNSSEMRIYASGAIYTNGVPTLFWDVVGGLSTLPPGMTLDQTALAPYVLITGTPTTAGTYTFDISATHAFTGDRQSRSYTMTIAGISTSSLPDGDEDVAYSETLATAGLTAPITFRISNGALPAGITLNTSTGEISGTPTESGDFTFTVEVTDATGRVCSKEYSITIDEAACELIENLACTNQTNHVGAPAGTLDVLIRWTYTPGIVPAVVQTVQRSLDNSTWSDIGVGTISVSAPFNYRFTDSARTAGTTYYYRIKPATCTTSSTSISVFTWPNSVTIAAAFSDCGSCTLVGDPDSSPILTRAGTAWIGDFHIGGILYGGRITQAFGPPRWHLNIRCDDGDFGPLLFSGDLSVDFLFEIAPLGTFTSDAPGTYCMGDTILITL